MILVPDTNVWIKVMNPTTSPAKDRLRAADPAVIRLCSVAKAELYYGAFRSSRKKSNLALLEGLFQHYESLPFDDAAATVYGSLRARLAARGALIGPNDLLIAAIALTHGATLITHNAREFGRVPDLQMQDWED